MSERAVDIKIEMVQTEPDGSKCFNCGEVVYLKAWRLRFTMASTGLHLCDSEAMACDACVGPRPWRT